MTTEPFKVIESSWSDTAILGPNGLCAVVSIEHLATEENQAEWEAKASAFVRLMAVAPMLLAAARLGLAEAEDWIHDELDGTQLLVAALAKLDPIRTAIAAATEKQP